VSYFYELFSFLAGQYFLMNCVMNESINCINFRPTCSIQKSRLAHHCQYLKVSFTGIHMPLNNSLEWRCIQSWTTCFILFSSASLCLLHPCTTRSVKLLMKHEHDHEAWSWSMILNHDYDKNHQQMSTTLV
jgi:hypothetical protein